VKEEETFTETETDAGRLSPFCTAPKRLFGLLKEKGKAVMMMILVSQQMPRRPHTLLPQNQSPWK
jgi:hypothetical protein